MSSKLVRVLTAALALQIIGAASNVCPDDANCICGRTRAFQIDCNIDGIEVEISFLPNTYLSINCGNAPSNIIYEKLPKLSANSDSSFKSVSFKDCPLPLTSFKDVLSGIGVSKTMSLIFQNRKNLTNVLHRTHFSGLNDVTKLLLSVNGVKYLPDNLFMDMQNLTWLNIRSNGINLSEELFKPLERLETLEISHNHMTNISANLFSHLSFLRKLSLWQSNVTRFSKDLFSGVDVLEELDLSSNGLNELPASIFHPLKKLKKLTLFANKFSSLPTDLFNNNEVLDTVNIFNNDVKLQELPRRLFNSLSSLKEVYIQRCGLENIPYDVFANSPQITNMSLAYNDIETLPEAVFNDQINLLELDLGFNRIIKLETKIFSSLVRLERLRLCHNSLKEISGSTFSSLLSLIYLDMEHNNLKAISSYMFSNNKQRMSINLAYNQLDFETKEMFNNSWITKRISPFAQTYNLRLLNLSHNNFKVTFNDWWLNGHDNLDFSFNNISELWSPDMPPITVSDKRQYMKEYYQKPLKHVWVVPNPLLCNCKTASFLTQLGIGNTKGVELNQLQCKFMQLSFCEESDVGFFFLVPFIIVFVVLATIASTIHRKRLYVLAKNIAFKMHGNYEKNVREITVLYSEFDDEFVLHEMLPGLASQKNFKIHTRQVNTKPSLMDNWKTSVKESDATVIVFSPNYLTSAYKNVDIKKIRGEMMKSKNSVYIYVDIGPENSIYAFLKEQRDRRFTVLWNEPDFWNIFFGMLAEEASSDSNIVDFGLDTLRQPLTLNFVQKNRFAKGPQLKLSENSQLSGLDTLAHSQV